MAGGELKVPDTFYPSQILGRWISGECPEPETRLWFFSKIEMSIILEIRFLDIKYGFIKQNIDQHS